MKNKTVVIKCVVLTSMTLLLITYIFINSSFDADTSDSHSLGIRAMINDFFASINICIVLSDHFVRKCAHFVEFFALGTLLFFTVKSYIQSVDKRLFFAPLVGFVVACIDEFIQLFSQGRSAQISDVMLDFSGVCTAVLIFICIHKLHKFKKDKEVSNERS